MRPRSFVAPLAVVVSLACGSSTPPAVSPSAPAAAPATSERSFSAFTARFTKGFLARFPTDSTDLGDHSHDGEWPDVSAAGDAALLAFIVSSRSELASFAREPLGEEEHADATILANALDRMQFEIEEMRSAELSPRFYANLIADGLDPLLTREFAPLDVRMRSAESRLRGVPALVAVAKLRLGRPPRVNTETAIEQTKGLVGLCERQLPDLFAKVPALQGGLEAARQQALAALRDLLAFLHDDVLPRSDGSFRVGRATFEKTLRFQLDDPGIDSDALERDARATMRETQERMLATALELWPTLMSGPPPQPSTDADRKSTIRAVLDKLAEDHPSDDTIVPEGRRSLAEATEFVRAHDLVSLPVEPCGVIEMPEYRRGVATAYCDSSGPLEPNPSTVVVISPPPADWPAERRASHYREYNRSLLANLLVHEGMPGHYLQHMHANHFRSNVRDVFMNHAFAEGWAVYAEWLMAKNGYGGPRVHMAQLKMLLRSATNAVLDHEIQAGSMDEKEAVALMESEAFQEEGEAVKKWRRARLSAGQLSTYFYGFRELMTLRKEAEAKPGFHERAYNDRLLAFGTPPLRVLREQLHATN